MVLEDPLASLCRRVTYITSPRIHVWERYRPQGDCKVVPHLRISLNNQYEATRTFLIRRSYLAVLDLTYNSRSKSK